MAALWRLRQGMLSRMLSASVHLLRKTKAAPSVAHNTLKMCHLFYCSQAHSGCLPLPGLALSVLSTETAEVPPLLFGYTVGTSGLERQPAPLHALLGVQPSQVRTSCQCEWAAKLLCPHISRPLLRLAVKVFPMGEFLCCRNSCLRN